MGCRTSSTREKWKELATVSIWIFYYYHLQNMLHWSTTCPALYDIIMSSGLLNLWCTTIVSLQLVLHLFYYIMILSLLRLFRIKPRLANPSFRPQKTDILATVDNFLNLLRIRYSSPLFRLKTANTIQVRHFKFHHYIKLFHLWLLVPGYKVLNQQNGYSLSVTNYFNYIFLRPRHQYFHFVSDSFLCQIYS